MGYGRGTGPRVEQCLTWMLRRHLDMDRELGRKTVLQERLTFIRIPPTEVSSIRDPWNTRKIATEDVGGRNGYQVGWNVPKRLPNSLYPLNVIKEEYTE